MLASLDTILEPWARLNGVHLFKKYQDISVRTIVITSAAGSKCQIWIEYPSPSGDILVRAWDYGKRKLVWHTDKQGLSSALDTALSAAKTWL